MQLIQSAQVLQVMILHYALHKQNKIHKEWYIYQVINIRGKSPNMWRCPNKGRYIISYQEVLSSLLKNINHQVDEPVLCNHSINGQLLRTSVLTGRLCFGAL